MTAPPTTNVCGTSGWVHRRVLLDPTIGAYPTSPTTLAAVPIARCRGHASGRRQRLDPSIRALAWSAVRPWSFSAPSNSAWARWRARNSILWSAALHVHRAVARRLDGQEDQLGVALGDERLDAV